MLIDDLVLDFKSNLQYSRHSILFVYKNVCIICIEEVVVEYSCHLFYFLILNFSVLHINWF